MINAVLAIFSLVYMAFAMSITAIYHDWATFSIVTVTGLIGLVVAAR